MFAFVRRLAAAAALMGLLLAWPGAASATITGGCTGEGHSTSSSVDLTTGTEWHLKRDDIAGGSGTSPVKMRSASVAAYALGIGLPIASGTSQSGDTAGSVDGLSVATYAILGKRFTVGGSASGDGQCSLQIRIVLDDVDALMTVLGGGGVIIFVIALVVVLALSRSGGGCLPRLIGGLFGALGGTGAALAGEQFGVLDPTQYFGLIIAIACGIAGFLIPGLFGGGGGDGTPAPVAPTPVAPTPPPAPAQPMTHEEMGNTATDIFKADEAPGDATGGQVVGGVGSTGDAASRETYPGGGVGGGDPM